MIDIDWSGLVRVKMRGRYLQRPIPNLPLKEQLCVDPLSSLSSSAWNPNIYSCWVLWVMIMKCKNHQFKMLHGMSPPSMIKHASLDQWRICLKILSTPGGSGSWRRQHATINAKRPYTANACQACHWKLKVYRFLFCAEIGAWHTRTVSNCHILLMSRNLS